MNAIALRHQLKEQARRRRQINFSIHPRKPMPQNWTEDQLEAQLTEYVERGVLIKKLTQEHKAQGESIRQHYEANTLSSCGLETHCVNVVSKTKIEYSDKYRREKARIDQQFEEARQKEEENFRNPDYTGPDQCKSIEMNPYNHMQVVLRKGN
tara:strand:- start:2981 stop:3439 length:459 start_codon:yes stop_codon:yes gene_type:complete